MGSGIGGVWWCCLVWVVCCIVWLVGSLVACCGAGFFFGCVEVD